MNAIILLLAVSTAGVDVGWQPLAGGGFEYIIQIDPAELDSLKAGNDIISEIPPELAGVKRYRITIGTGPVPRIGTPPEVASGQYNPNTSASQQHDPFAAGASTNATPSNAGQTNTNADRYGAAASNVPSNWPPNATSGDNNLGGTNTAMGDAAGTDAAGSGASATQDSGSDLMNRVRDRVHGNTATGNNSPGENSSNGTGQGTDSSDASGIPQMDENPFRTDRYATAPQYGTDATRFSADPQSAAAGQTGDAAGSNSVDHGDLPHGEYVRPLSATSTTSGSVDPFAASTPQGNSTQGTADRYRDRYADRSGDDDPFATGRAADNNDNSLQEANGQDSANTSSGGLKLSDIDTSKDAFGRSLPEEETAPPTLNPDNATRLANYRDDEQGPSSSDKKSASTPPEEQGKSTWQWALLVLAMCASLGANGWMALLLRDSRRKYSQLLERFQQGDDEEYEDEEDVHYEAA